MSRLATASGVVVALLVTSIATPATAQEEPDADAPDEETGRIELTLLDQTFDLEPNGDIELSYRLTGDLAQVADLGVAGVEDTAVATDEPDADPDADADPDIPSQLDIRVLNYEAIDLETDLDDIVGSNPRRNRLPDVIDGVDLLDVRSRIELDAEDSATISISVPTDVEFSISENLQFTEDGIHPIVVQFRVDGNVVAEHGTLVERRGGSVFVPPPIDLALFARAPDPGPSAPAADRREAVESFAELVELAEATEPSIAIDVAPGIAVDLSAGGRLGDEVTAALVDDEFLSAPATPFDVSSAASVDRVDAFNRQLVAGEEELFRSLRQPPTRAMWHPTSPLSGEGAEVLRDDGVRYLAMTDDLFDSTVADIETIDGRDRFVPVRLPDTTTMPVMVIDDDFGASFTTEATEATLARSTPLEWSIATVARLRLEQLESSLDDRTAARSRLVAVPGLGAFDPRLVNELHRFSATTGAIRFTRATSLLANTDTDTDTSGGDLTLPERAGPSLEARLDRIFDVRIALEDVASMLPDDDERPPAWERRLDSFVSTSFADDEVDAALDELLAEAAFLRSGIVAPEPDTFTLTGDGSITVRIGNELDEPLDVVLRLRSPRLSFPDGDVPVTLEPGDFTDIEVPIEIRSNGTSPVTVDVTTPLGTPLVEPVTLTARVNALTGLGQVLTGAFVLVLFAWWFSHWRARRRGVDEPAAPAHALADADADVSDDDAWTDETTATAD